MPYWFESNNLRVGKDLDRRRKLTDEERETIKSLYQNGVSIRRIAKIFEHKVTRRAIQFILFPERLEKQYDYKRDRHWDYERERHKKAVKNYRIHLKEIYGLRGR